MPGYGYQSFLGFTAETVWGSKVSPTTKFLELLPGGDRLKKDSPPLISQGLNELSIHRARKVRKGAVTAGGSVEFEIPYSGGELLFKHLFGKVATTGTGPYTHVFTLSPADWLALVGLTMESRTDHATANSFFYEGALLPAGSFSVGLDGYWRASAEVAAEDETTGSPSTPTFSAAPLANFYDDGSGSGLTFNAAGYDVTNFSLDLNLGLQTDRRYLGSRLIKKPTPGRDAYNALGRFRAVFENLNAYNDFVAQTERALVVKSVGDAISGGFYSLQFDVAVGILTQARPVAEDRGVIHADYGFQGFYDGTNRELKMTLVNSTAGPI